MIVMKFGGTSVEDATAIRRLISIVKTHLHRQPIVAVSAMGKTTNGLLESMRLASGGDLTGAITCLDSIESHHLLAADELSLPEEKDRLQADLKERFDSIRLMMKEINQTGSIGPRHSDAVSSNGELLSSMIVAAGFRSAGIKGPLGRHSSDDANER